MKETTHTLRDGRAVIIRDATPADAEALLIYVNRVAAESPNLSFGAGEFELSVAEEEAFLQSCLDSELMVYLLAEVDGPSGGRELAGSINFSTRDRDRVRHTGSFGVTVRADHWGLGIGSILLDALIGWARDGGIVTKINLQVRSDNAVAIRLYERHGFVREGVISRAMRVDGEYVDNDWMGLCL